QFNAFALAAAIVPPTSVNSTNSGEGISLPARNIAGIVATNSSSITRGFANEAYAEINSRMPRCGPRPVGCCSVVSLSAPMSPRPRAACANDISLPVARSVVVREPVIYLHTPGRSRSCPDPRPPRRRCGDGCPRCGTDHKPHDTGYPAHGQGVGRYPDTRAGRQLRCAHPENLGID